MGLPVTYSATQAPALSALQELLASNSTFALADNASVGREQYRNLALQIAHNLRFQHSWSDIRLHTIRAPGDDSQTFALLSGMPPQRLYIDPDEQIELLQQQKKQGKSGLPELSAEREWVVPSHLREKWTLRRIGNTFDAISIVPRPADGMLVELLAHGEATSPAAVDGLTNKWRTKKRFLLATLDDDSTIVYYIVHDGLQKPRQN